MYGYRQAKLACWTSQIPMRNGIGDITLHFICINKYDILFISGQVPNSGF